MDAVFPLIIRCILIKASLVDSLSILGSIGIRKSTRNPLTLIVVPATLSCTLVGIDGGFFPCDNSSNMLRR